MNSTSQKNLAQLQKTHHIQFEAHYWGKFELLPIDFQLLQDKSDESILLPIAQKVNDPTIQFFYNPKKQQYFVPDFFDQAIAFEENDFWDQQPINLKIDSTEKTTLEQKSVLYFDKRKPLEDLLESQEYLITSISDPEHFENIEAYFDLLTLLQQLSKDRVQFDEVSGKAISESQKEIILKKGTKFWQVNLNRELFDNDFIIRINEIMLEWGINDFRFASTVNKQMQMVLLKLNEEKFALLKRMGMLI